MGRQEIGTVFNYFSKAAVAAVQLNAGELKVGDTIVIEGPGVSITMEVESMQIDRQPVESARAGQSVGLKVPERVRPGDKVYRLDPEP